MNFQTMSKQRKFILIAAVVGIIGVFLPWVKFLFLDYNGMHGNGIIVFLCLVGAIVVAFMGDQTKNLEKTFWFIALACGALASLIMIYNIIDLRAAMSYLGFGFYMAVLGSLGVLLSAYMYRSPTDSVKGGFDSLKKDIEDKTKTTS